MSFAFFFWGGGAISSVGTSIVNWKRVMVLSSRTRTIVFLPARCRHKRTGAFLSARHDKVSLPGRKKNVIVWGLRQFLDMNMVIH